MIRRYILGYISALVMLMGIFTAVPLQTASAVNPKCENSFLTFPAWYRGLPSYGPNQGCALKGPGDLGGNSSTQLSRYIWIIVLNVLEIMLQAVVYIAAGFIIWGGFMYLISSGQSDRITTARKMIQNAIIGMVISLFAVIAVSFISGSLV